MSTVTSNTSNVNYILENGIKIIKGVPLIEISKLKLHPNNIKSHPEEQINNLCKLMKIVGFKDPIVVDKKFEVKAGHGRLLAAQQLGMTKVPYIPLEGLTKKQMDLFMYMDNYINESPWIEDNVQLLLEDMPVTLLDNFEVKWDDVITLESTEEKEIPEPPVEPKSKLGDIYQLGNHKVMCGDATDEKSISRLLVDSTVDSLQTDPPYGIDYASKNEFLNKQDKGNRIQIPFENDGVMADYTKFVKDFLIHIPFSEYNTVYLWLSDLRTLEVWKAITDAGIKFSTQLIWVKNNHVLGHLDHAPKHETCLYGWKGKHKFYGGFKTSVYEYPKPLVNDLHPTMKPLELITEFIKESTQKNMLVYDPFLGSGTTLIACEQTNRICFGMELDPAYVDVIIQRWENYTDKKAKLIKK